MPDGKPRTHPGMQDRRLREKLVGQVRHPLATPAQLPVPVDDDVIAERHDPRLFVGTAR